MTKVRYYADKGSFWKFEIGKPPMTKTNLYAEWRPSYFRSLGEFLRDPWVIPEVTAEEAEPNSEYHSGAK